MDALDEVHLNFSEESLLVLNLAVGFIMYGVALGIKKSDFAPLIRSPKPILIGVLSQFLILPIMTLVLVFGMNPLPSVALGMFLVASCPGGNVSNFFSAMARGNVALSVSLTAFATLSAAVFTPLNFSILGSLYPETAQLLRDFEISFFELFKTILLLLILPLILGIVTAEKFPKFTRKSKPIISNLSFLCLIAFIVVAFYNNRSYFISHIHYVALVVFLHNAIALGSGFLVAKFSGLKNREATTISMETGIQNSGLALVIIFNFFDGNGGMSMIAAWWGIWHIVSGTVVSKFYARFINKKVHGIGA